MVLYSKSTSQDGPMTDVPDAAPKNSDVPSTEPDAPEIAALKNFYSKHDGSPNAWENIRPLLKSVFHLDFKYIANDEEINYEDVVALTKKSTRNGCIAKLERAKMYPDGTVMTVVSHVVPGHGRFLTVQRLFYDHGKVVRAEPVANSKSAMNSFIAYLSTLPEDEPKVAVLKEYFSKYDGSLGAWDNLKPILNKVFHPEVKLILNGKEIGFDGVKKIILKATQCSLVRQVERIQENSDGSLTVAVNNRLPGEDSVLTEVRIFHFEGKVIRCEGDSDARDMYSDYIGHMLALPDNRGDPKIGMLVEYFSKLDGSPNAWENVKPILSSMLHPNFKCVLKNEEMSRDDFLHVTHKFAENGCTAELQNVRKAPDGSVLITVRDHLPGEEGELGTRRLFYEDNMVVRVEPIEGQEAKWSALIRRVSSLPSQDPDIAALADFISKYDGSASAWKKVEPLIRERTHPDFIMVANGREIGFDAAMDLARKATQNGCVRKLERARKHPDGSLTVRVYNCIPGEEGRLVEHREYFRDGKIIRHETAPTDEARWGALIDRVSGLPDVRLESSGGEVDDVAEKFERFINAFDGSSDAWSRAEPLLREIFRSDFTVSTHDGERGIDWWISFCETFARKRNIAIVQGVERTDTGLITAINNRVEGKSIYTTERGLVEDGMIIHWEAVPGHETNFTKVVDSVLC